MANNVLKILSLIFGLLASALIFLKTIMFVPQFVQIGDYLVEEGTTWEEQGVNSSLVWLTIIISISVAILIILGSIKTLKESKIGPILVLILSILVTAGFYVLLVDASFTVGMYSIFLEAPLVQTTLGIRNGIFCALSGILGLVALKGKK